MSTWSEVCFLTKEVIHQGNSVYVALIDNNATSPIQWSFSIPPVAARINSPNTIIITEACPTSSLQKDQIWDPTDLTTETTYPVCFSSSVFDHLKDIKMNQNPGSSIPIGRSALYEKSRLKTAIGMCQARISQIPRNLPSRIRNNLLNVYSGVTNVLGPSCSDDILVGFPQMCTEHIRQQVPIDQYLEFYIRSYIIHHGVRSLQHND